MQMHSSPSGMHRRGTSTTRLPTGKVASSTTTSTSNAPMHSPPIKASEIDLEDGIVDMDAFSQILALDETDPSREFSKALVWAWCDQAEHAVEEMEEFLANGNVTALASKAHYLKGSSASLGLIHVSQTCQSIYHIHFPPTLAQFRSYSYQSNYSGASSSSSGSGSGSGSGSDSSSTGQQVPRRSTMGGGGGAGGKPSHSPSHSPEMQGMDFEANKLTRASNHIARLKEEIRQASEWLYEYYQGADKYAGIIRA